MKVQTLFTLCILILYSCNNIEPKARVEVKQSSKVAELSKVLKPYSNLLQFDHLKGPVKSMTLSTFHASKKQGAYKKLMLGNEYITSYRKDGNGIEKRYFNSAKKLQTKTLYDIDKSGKCTQAKVYNSSGVLTKLIKYRLDAKTNIIEEISYKPNNEIISKLTFKYDHIGRLIEDTKFIGSNQFDIRCLYFYDPKNEIIETKYYRPEGKMIINGKTSYADFDQKGNWIKCIEQTNKGSVFIVERIITYYP